MMVSDDRMKGIQPIVLAAGQSRRLGRPKQLLPMSDSTLLGHTVTEVLALGTRAPLIVTGGESQRVSAELEARFGAKEWVGQQRHGNTNVYWSFNAAFAEGMGSSLSFGVRQVLGAEKTAESTSEIAAILVLVCDQPMLCRSHLQNLVASVQEPHRSFIVVSDYSGPDKGASASFGPPVLFSSHYFDALAELKGDQGAKGIIKKNREFVSRVAFGGGAYDIDSPEDVTRYLDARL